MSKKKKKNILAVAALCLIMTFAVAGTVLAGTVPDDLTGAEDFLVLHDLDDDYSEEDLGGPSSITVMDGATEIFPTDDGEGHLTYAGVPDGATITIEYVFHLNDGDESAGDINEYGANNYFYIDLPGGVDFDYTSGASYEVYATDENGGDDWHLATWTFEDADTIKVTLTAAAADHRGMNGSFGITGTFAVWEEGDGASTTIKLSGQEITFVRKLPPAPEIGLTKEGSYDATENEITWTIIVTPPEGVDLGGYALEDTYSANPGQSFVDDSFYIEAAGGEPVNIVNTGADPDPDLAVDTANHAVVYTFPAETTGEQIITYKTTPDSFGAETGASGAQDSTFTNTAVIKDGDTELTDPASDTVTLDWIEKEGSLVATGDDSLIINWVVTVIVPEDGTVTGAEISDTFPAGLELIEDDPVNYPIAVSINYAKPASIVSEGVGFNTYSYADASREFTYRCPDMGVTMVRLSYSTRVVDCDTYLNSNTEISFTNSAFFSWAENPDSSLPGDYDEVGVVGSGGLINKTSAGDSGETYIYPGYIHWTITVNRNKIAMDDVTIADDIPAGQRLLINDGHAFTVKQGNSILTQTIDIAAAPAALTSDDNFVRDFSYALGDISGTYTIDYYTQIIDIDPSAIGDADGLDTLYANDDEVDFGNSVTLFRDGGRVDVNGNKRYSSQLLGKSVAEQYDYDQHTVKWLITVNRSRLPLTGVQVADELPVGMTLLIDSDHPFIVLKRGGTVSLADAPTTGASGGDAFTYNLGDISDEYTISFYTKMTDEQLLAQWNDSRPFVNNASLTAGQWEGAVTASATAYITNPVVTKGYSYNSADNADYIEWSVAINTAQRTLSGAYVEDELAPGLRLDASSVKLYQVSIAADGTVGEAEDEDSALVTEGYSVELPTADNNNTLTVWLPENSSSVYRLEFTTDIISDDLDTTNKVYLYGDASSPSGEGKSGNIAINDLWSKGGSGSITLTIHKVDENGDPVEGATYKLLNSSRREVTKGGAAMTAETDSNGDAVFKNLPKWIFYVQESATPDGYLLNPEIITVNGGQRLTGNLVVNAVNQIADGDIVIKKQSASGRPLSGGEFTLVSTDDGNTFTMTRPSVNGIVTFNGVPLGNYRITETEAPRGYYLTDAVITATVEYVDYDEDRTATMVTVTSDTDTLVNEMLPREDGDYIVRETAAPQGYILAGEEIAVTVSAGGTYQFSVENERSDEYYLFDDGTPGGNMTLPQTGGPLDTAALLALGTALIIAGLAARLALKKKQRNN